MGGRERSGGRQSAGVGGSRMGGRFWKQTRPRISPLHKSRAPERSARLGLTTQKFVNCSRPLLLDTSSSISFLLATRERDRQRAQARKPVVKGRDDGLTPEQRRERDAKALQEKAARKAAQATGQGGNGGAGAKGKSGGKK
uniref:Small EDRK-rich factor-like N-terminal domain-containing protein n=1 Tax=Oryza glumipatula TaxID=40148 RepID=A0A0D9ZZ21_9ORYZ